MALPLIQVKNLSFEYAVNQTKIPVLHDISFEVKPGEYVVIIGHNGSGKSTLSKHLNGILTPVSGDVVVNGWNTKEWSSMREIRQKVGMVFQHPDNQIVATIVEDDVAFGLENLEIPPSEMKERIDFALASVGMNEFRNRPPHYLSGGQKQRVAIAGVLAMKPDCLVLDEATSMLDTHGRNEILKVVRKLNDEGMAIISVTHHMSEAAQASRVIVIEKGRIIMDGTPREIFQQEEELKRLHLDIPVASQMARKVQSHHHDFNGTLIHNDEIVKEVVRLSQREVPVI
ncbi:energy-coupling factor transport system ATP-binding protein [Fictibacillus solisalsi]|uniref:Energy-coupling factor transport system ATP-binding protein n=1 Tax=Fictibacillus solisalsi TaxID=459525 RepID=A0A1G9VP91_9BACL|nr:energy-coupling factor transporter ATPase [Fictibacillus solisalsi]SDM73999.1 energy-coupling factor transport system ATP-binding protein [Fictibacillus solisalsi]